MAANLPHDKKAAITAALAGGWVADAASLGLHWLYSSERIAEVGGQTPEFLPPRADYYTKGFGYFAHEGKQVGEQRQSGHPRLPAPVPFFFWARRTLAGLHR